MKLSVEITPELNHKLKELAKRDRRTLMAYAEKALEAHADREDRKVKAFDLSIKAAS